MRYELTSVASIIDDETLMVYPKYQTGGVDEDGGINVFSLSPTFLKCLDEWDRIIVEEIKYVNKKKDDSRKIKES